MQARGWVRVRSHYGAMELVLDTSPALWGETGGRAERGLESTWSEVGEDGRAVARFG
jgi:hypothetical protein